MREFDWPVGASRAVVFNTEAAYLFLTDAEYRRDAEGANDVFCDGAGLQLYAAMRFGRVVRRRHGPDILNDYLQSRSGARVHFVGGSDACHAALKVRFPEFFARNDVSIFSDWLKTDAEFVVCAQTIAREQYDDVLIFLGLARQERLQRMLHESGFRGSSIGLGAAIDFISGVKKRAGGVWQKLGLEWLPRLIREPRMLPRVGRSFGLFLLCFNRGNRALTDYLRRAAPKNNPTGA